MTDYLECYNFFKECRAFALKHERFMTACKRIREQNEKVDPKLLYALAELFVDIKREMESTCIEHKCIVNLYDTDEDMQSDISSIPESENDDMEEGSSTDESDNEEDENETDESNNEEDENETDGSEIEVEKADDKDADVDNEDYDDDLADFFQTTNCCIHELIDPFFQAMIETKQTDVIREIQKLNDQYEQSCLRFNDWFSPHEMDECALMMKEIISNYEKEGTAYFKLCESKFIKLLVTCCRETINDKEGKNIFGENYGKIIDSEYPLNKMRKMFTKEDYMVKILDHICYNIMPDVCDYLEERQSNILQKMKCT